jgi:hypothetical protein
LGWHTTTPILELLEVPHQFSTTSRVAVVGNYWKTLNADVAALEDRGHVLLFEPTALEVHCPGPNSDRSFCQINAVWIVVW